MKKLKWYFILFAVLLNVLAIYLYFIEPVFRYKFIIDKAIDDAIIVFVLLLIYLLLLLFYFILERKELLKRSINNICYYIIKSTHVLSIFTSIFTMMLVLIGSSSGYSYTRDINNYMMVEKNEEYFNYFPKEIDDNMKDVKYGYFFDLNDAYALELYLEAKFENKEILNTYLNETLNKVGIDNLVLSSNEGDSNYMTYYLKESIYEIEKISKPNQRVNYSIFANMFTISYCYESNTLIWDCMLFGEFFTDEYITPFYFEKFKIEIIDKKFKINNAS